MSETEGGYLVPKEYSDALLNPPTDSDWPKITITIPRSALRPRALARAARATKRQARRHRLLGLRNAKRAGLKCIHSISFGGTTFRGVASVRVYGIDDMREKHVIKVSDVKAEAFACFTTGGI